MNSLLIITNQIRCFCFSKQSSGSVVFMYQAIATLTTDEPFDSSHCYLFINISSSDISSYPSKYLIEQVQIVKTMPHVLNCKTNEAVLPKKKRNNCVLTKRSYEFVYSYLYIHTLLLKTTKLYQKV
jgi:hypothetical protein